MSYAVHTKPLESLEWADVQELVEREAEESVTLEFKGAGIWGDAVFGKDPDRPLLREHDMARNDIVEAICAFANAYGGVLVVGVATGGQADKAVRIDPAPGVDAKAQRLSDIGATCFDPPLHGLEMRVIPSPENRESGVIIFRVAASLAAPHAAKYSVVTGKRNAQKPLTGDVAVWRPFVRRNADTKDMTMRDLHNVFWETRTRQERLHLMRARGEERLAELVKFRDAGLLPLWVDGNEFVDRATAGAFVRCSAVFRDPLECKLTDLKQVGLVEPHACGLKFDSPLGRLDVIGRPIVDGVFVPYFSGAALRVLTDGTHDLTCFLEGSPPDQSYRGFSATRFYNPLDFVYFFSAVACSATAVRGRAKAPSAPFEIDMHVRLDQLAAASLRYHVDERKPTHLDFTIGPYAIFEAADLVDALKQAHVAIFRAFGYDIFEPGRHQTFTEIEKLARA